jgi:mono/diheme cytochrome c family protein
LRPSLSQRFLLPLAAAATASFSLGAEPAVTSEAALENQFNGTVRPFLETYCLSCHGTEKQEAELNLSPFSTVASVVDGFAHWELVLERLDAAEMPPAKARKQPTDAQREQVVAWIQALRKNESEKRAGDPGPVLARRLSNAEYDYSIRDLTGVDIRPTKEFPVDPANQAGFDNTGE